MDEVIGGRWGGEGRFFGLVSYLQSPFLLFVLLYWGWQLAQNGWAKFHHLSNVAEYFGTPGLAMTAPIAVLAHPRGPQYSAPFERTGKHTSAPQSHLNLVCRLLP